MDQLFTGQETPGVTLTVLEVPANVRPRIFTTGICLVGDGGRKNSHQMAPKCSRGLDLGNTKNSLGYLLAGRLGDLFTSR